MLPRAVQRHFGIEPYVGDYKRLSDARREQLWTRITAWLAEGLSAAEADPSLKAGGGTELSDRPKSLVERIIAACDSLEAVFAGGAAWETALDELKSASEGTPAHSDARTLDRLLHKSRIPDVDAWRSEVDRAIWHAKHIGHMQHHRPAG